MLNLIAIICLMFVVAESECSNILAIFPIPSISHQYVFRPLVNKLINRGHKVTVISPDPQYSDHNRPQNLTEIDLHDISYTMWNTIMNVEKGKESEGQSNLYVIFEMINSIFEEQIKSSEVQKLIKNRKKKFDLLFVEDCVRAAISFSSIYKAPVIKISSFGPFYETFQMIGSDTNRLVYPMPMRQKLNNLTLWDKMTEMYIQYKTEHVYAETEKSENKMIKRLFGRHTPDISELKKNVEMIFINVHPMWDFNRPVPPNVIYLGGLHQKPTRPLPKNLKSYLDSSKNGVIYMSFGTNVKSSLLPPEKIQVFTKVFSQLPYDVLWKWDKDEILGCSKNVRISKWFPQSDLLKHPNIKVFITQGGLQSTDEAINAGVPMVGIPMLADQWYNVEMYIKHNIGLKLSIETITEDMLKNAIETVAKSKNYGENVVKLRNIMHDQPQSSLERAVWWTEHVLRHGGAAHLRTPAAHMHWTEYYALDLVLIFLSILIILVTSVGFGIYFVASKFRNIIRFKTKIH